jgi:hypothetical protein
MVFRGERDRSTETPCERDGVGYRRFSTEFGSEGTASMPAFCPGGESVRGRLKQGGEREQGPHLDTGRAK